MSDFEFVPAYSDDEMSMADDLFGPVSSPASAVEAVEAVEVSMVPDIAACNIVAEVPATPVAEVAAPVVAAPVVETPTVAAAVPAQPKAADADVVDAGTVEVAGMNPFAARFEWSMLVFAAIAAGLLVTLALPWWVQDIVPQTYHVPDGTGGTVSFQAKGAVSESLSGFASGGFSVISGLLVAAAAGAFAVYGRRLYRNAPLWVVPVGAVVFLGANPRTGRLPAAPPGGGAAIGMSSEMPRLQGAGMELVSSFRSLLMIALAVTALWGFLLWRADRKAAQEAAGVVSSSLFDRVRGALLAFLEPAKADVKAK